MYQLSRTIPSSTMTSENISIIILYKILFLYLHKRKLKIT
nr:MAG TPA: hypothetical protein [Caudoviricetes sp.]